MSIWDAAGDGLFFSKNGVAKLLDGDDGATPTLEGLLREDEFIQETQAQSPKLIQFLRSREIFEGMLGYLVATPPDTAGEDCAYRFPYMVCEAFSCAVPALLDELVTEQSLCALFSLLLPALRPDMQAGRRGRPAPYVLGYWAKVVALLCKRRPAALMRFLSLQRGVAAALVGHLDNGSVATLLSASLLRLPFSARFGGMARLFLCSADPESLPALLLGAMRRALDAASDPASVTPSAASPAELSASAGHAAAVISDAMAAAKSARPHAKYLTEGYNAARTSQSRRPGVGASGGGVDDEDASGSAGIPAAVAWRREGLAWPCANGLGATPDALAPVPDPARSLTNTQVDTAFHSAAVTQGDSTPLRLLKWLRDGAGAAGTAAGGPAGLVAVADAAVALLSAALPVPTGGGPGASPAPAPPLRSSALAACEAPLVALAAALDTTAFGWRQQAVAGFGHDSIDPLAVPHQQQAVQQQQAQVGAAPALCEAVAARLPAWAAYLQGLAAAGAAVHCPGGGPLPVTQAQAAAAVAAANAAPSPAPSSVASLPLGTAPLALARVCAAALGCGWPCVAEAAAAARLPAALLDLCAAFPWHSVLHGVVGGALADALAQGPPTLLRAVVAPAAEGGADLPQRVAAGLLFAGLPASVQEQYPPSPAPASPVTAPRRPPRGLRAGYGGHLASLGLQLLALQAAGALPIPAALLPSDEDSGGGWWPETVRGPLAAYGAAHALLLGGSLAPDPKKTGQVGANADASAKPAAVDEVAALGAAPASEEEDGDGDVGSGSDEGEGDDAGSDSDVAPELSAEAAAARRRRAVTGEDSDGEEEEESKSPLSGDERGEEEAPPDVDFTTAVFSSPPTDRPVMRPATAVALSAAASAAADASAEDWDAGFGSATPAPAVAEEGGVPPPPHDDWDADFGSAPTAPAADSFAAASGAPAAPVSDDWGAFGPSLDAPSAPFAPVASGADDWGAFGPPSDAPAPTSAPAAGHEWGVAPISTLDAPTTGDEWGVVPAPTSGAPAANDEWGVAQPAPASGPTGTSASAPSTGGYWAADFVVPSAASGGGAAAADAWDSPASGQPPDHVAEKALGAVAVDEWGVAFPATSPASASATAASTAAVVAGDTDFAAWGSVTAGDAFGASDAAAPSSSIVAAASTAVAVASSSSADGFDDSEFGPTAGGADGFTGPPTLGDDAPLVARGGGGAAVGEAAPQQETDGVDSDGESEAPASDNEGGDGDAPAQQLADDGGEEEDGGSESGATPAATGHVLLDDGEEEEQEKEEEKQSEGAAGAGVTSSAAAVGRTAAAPASVAAAEPFPDDGFDSPAPASSAPAPAAAAARAAAPAAAPDDGFGWGEPLALPDASVAFDDSFGWDAPGGATGAAAAAAAATAPPPGAAAAAAHAPSADADFGGFGDGDWGASFGEAPAAASAGAPGASDDWGAADDWGK